MWTTWLYIDCCCDTFPRCQKDSTVKHAGTYLIDKDSLSESLHKFYDFLRVLRLIEDPRDLSLFR